MKLLDLFSGIGGFSLAASWCGIETVAFCEIDSFCQKVLNKNFPGIEIYEDIKKINGKEITDKYGAIDIICGGFPCQPFSVAGKRKGKEDDRYLWHEMLRVISEVKPAWVVGENVAGIVNMELDKVCSDLEAEGYEVQPFIIPACAVNAPHRRDRVWIIANRTSDGLHKGKSENNRSYKNGNTNGFAEILNEGDATNSEGLRHGGRRIYGNGKHRKQSLCKDIENNGNGIWGKTPSGDNQFKQIASNANSEHSKEFIGWDKLGYTGKEGTFGRSIHESMWERNWFEVATELCGIFNGLSMWIHRNRRLEKYAKITEFITEQDLPCLWKIFQSKSFQWKIRGFDKIYESENVFTILWQFFTGSQRQNNLPFESAKVQEAFLRNMWYGKEVGCPSQRWEYKEQYVSEYSDRLSYLSYEIALATQELSDWYNKNRTNRIKALGNSIVPQVAYEILKSIQEIQNVYSN